MVCTLVVHPMFPDGSLVSLSRIRNVGVLQEPGSLRTRFLGGPLGVKSPEVASGTGAGYGRDPGTPRPVTQTGHVEGTLPTRVRHDTGKKKKRKRLFS